MKIIEPAVLEENLELVDVEFKKSGPRRVLTVFIDKDEGITVEDCQRISRQIEDMIEINNLIQSSYVLEVSSPGLDRALKKERDFLRFKNKRVKVRTFSPLGNQKNFSGTIRDFREQTLFLEAAGKTLEIPLANIAKARLIIEI
ncbi:MAG: ribosome maturation factor RimP [Nitrospinaceae bacterium]